MMLGWTILDESPDSSMQNLMERTGSTSINVIAIGNNIQLTLAQRSILATMDQLQIAEMVIRLVIVDVVDA